METARRTGWKLPDLQAAVRTGDTPAAERQRLVRKPPHVLITTPESLHLMLTSRARDTLRGVTHCIIDEIHALCPNKRGVFLALLLERLSAINPRGFVRIGLSATQRPLDEVARFLGGAEPDAGGRLVPRPVAVVDAGLRKDLDLRVVSPVESVRADPGRVGVAVDLPPARRADPRTPFDHRFRQRPPFGGAHHGVPQRRRGNRPRPSRQRIA